MPIALSIPSCGYAKFVGLAKRLNRRFISAGSMRASAASSALNVGFQTPNLSLREYNVTHPASAEWLVFHWEGVLADG